MQRKTKTPVIRSKRICIVDSPSHIINNEIPFGQYSQLMPPPPLIINESSDTIIAVLVEDEPLSIETMNEELVEVAGDTLALDAKIVEKSVGALLPSVLCECGSFITSKTKSKHLKTKKHQNWVASTM